MCTRSHARRTTRRLRPSCSDTSGGGSDRPFADPTQSAGGDVAYLDGTFGTDWIKDNLARAGMPGPHLLCTALASPGSQTQP